MSTKTKRKTKLKKPVNSIKQSYDGIDFDSTPEMDMYILLKKAGIKFNYIGKENSLYKLVPEAKYEAECYERPQKRSPKLKDVRKISGLGYTADFVGENEEWFIEVKGRRLGDFNIRWKLFKKWLNQRDEPNPILFMPVTPQDMRQVIDILKEKGY